MTLTPIQQRICQHLQDGLEVTAQPFAQVAEKLNLNEDQLLQIIRDLKALEIIRRIGPSISYKALGKTSTLVTAHVPPEKIDLAAQTINALNEVSHNYLRDNHYNLWFTLQGDSERQIDSQLQTLHEKLNIEFHSLPAAGFFKLDVRFDLTSSQRTLPKPSKQQRKVHLTDLEKNILSKIQTPLEITQRPFDFLADKSTSIEEALAVLNSLLEKNVIRKIAAVLDHRKLGFEANVMFVCQLEPDNLPQVAEDLASWPAVTHCYQRKTFENWPYNLYAMIHAPKMPLLLQQVNNFVEKYNIKSYQLLPTISELKKKPVVYKL